MFIGCGTPAPLSLPLSPFRLYPRCASLFPPFAQLASIERSLAEVTAIQRQLGIKVDEDEDEKDLEVGLVYPCSAGLLAIVPKAYYGGQ